MAGSETLPAHLSYSGATIRVSLNTCKDWNTFSTGFSLEQWEERLLFDLQSCLFYGTTNAIILGNLISRRKKANQTI